MPKRGLPDYFNADTQVAQRLVDLTSVMAVIKGIPPIDGRGRIAYIDAFLEGLTAWVLLKGGDSSGFAVTTLGAEVPPCCALCTTGTAAGGGYSTMRKDFFTSFASKMGIEIAWNITPGDTLMIVSMHWYTSAGRLTGQAILNTDTGDIKLVTAGVDPVVANISPSIFSFAYYPIKLVCDFRTGFYSRLIVGQEEIDVSSIPLEHAAFTGIGEVITSIQVEAAGTGDETVKIGHYVLTLDEP